jgi:hypothetical protein
MYLTGMNYTETSGRHGVISASIIIFARTIQTETKLILLVAMSWHCLRRTGSITVKLK